MRKTTFECFRCFSQMETESQLYYHHLSSEIFQSILERKHVDQQSLGTVAKNFRRIQEKVSQIETHTYMPPSLKTKSTPHQRKFSFHTKVER